MFCKKNVCLCPEEGLNVLLCYLRFGPLLHLQYMQIHIEAFPQNCRHGKYLSCATLVTPINVLGAEQFAFPCQVFFRQRSSEHEQKPKLVFVEAE